MQAIKKLSNKLLIIGLGTILALGFTSLTQAHGGRYYSGGCTKCYYGGHRGYVKHYRYRHVVRVAYPYYNYNGGCNSCGYNYGCNSCNYCNTWSCSSCNYCY